VLAVADRPSVGRVEDAVAEPGEEPQRERRRLLAVGLEPEHLRRIIRAVGVGRRCRTVLG